jgi:hypothetical protein
MANYKITQRLTQIDAVTDEWRDLIRVTFPAGKTGSVTSNTVVGHQRTIVITVTDDPHAVSPMTYSPTYFRVIGETRVETEVVEDGKKKGQNFAIYDDIISLAA